MTWTWARRFLLVAATAVLAVEPAAAQRAAELGIHGVFTAQDEELFAGGLYGALRTTRRTRIALTIAAGSAGSEFVARGELLGHFLLSPTTRGVGVYAGGGIAGVVGPGEEGYLVLLVGAESAPGGRSGWAVEGGLGGGARVAVGYRWRWQRRAGRPE